MINSNPVTRFLVDFVMQFFLGMGRSVKNTRNLRKLS